VATSELLFILLRSLSTLKTCLSMRESVFIVYFISLFIMIKCYHFLCTLFCAIYKALSLRNVDRNAVAYVKWIDNNKKMCNEKFTFSLLFICI
jgi:hypothetical protein